MLHGQEVMVHMILLNDLADGLWDEIDHDDNKIIRLHTQEDEVWVQDSICHLTRNYNHVKNYS